MKTIFGVFESYPDAEEMIAALLDQDFSQQEMNVIIQEEIAKDNIDIDLQKANVVVTDEVGEKRMRGLDALLAREQPVEIPELQSIYAAGEIATIIAKTAAAPGTTQGEFRSVLNEFGIPEEAAETYVEGIKTGGLLFWIRTDDERAPDAANILRENNGQKVSSY
jgi:hypothetical protein